MANTSISKTFSSEGNRQKWTWSAWIKRSGLTTSSNGYTLWNCEGNNANDNFIFQIDGGGGTGGATDSIGLHTYGNDAFRTTPLLRDVNGWYHIVLALDTTQATATDRIKLYVNGVLQSYSQEANFPSQNYNMGINRAAKHCIGSHGTNANYYFDGSMSHIHFCDGYQYAASDFGEYDANGVWKIKTSPSVTYGTNGYFILKDGNSVTDQSGNGNDFTVAGGTLTNTEDCPSNVFCVFSPIDIPINSSGTTRTIHNLSNGNLTLINTNSDYREARSTFYLTEGKWYWEAKSTREGGSQSAVGVVLNSYAAGSGQRRLYQHNAKKYDDGGSSDYGATWTTNDIIGVALNLDDGEITFYKNGTSQGVAFTDLLTDIDNTGWTPFFASYNGDMSFNFGNGYFGSTPVSSAGTNASGIGIFEFDVPTGFTSLSTKGLNL